MVICPVCKKEFDSYTALAGHSNIHGGLRISKVCKICGKKYKEKRCRQNRGGHCSEKCRIEAFTKIGIKKGKETRFKKNNKPWNKNIPMSKQVKIKLSKKLKGMHSSSNTEFKRGRNPWNKGLEGYLAGEKHYNWKGGYFPYYGKGWYIQREKALKRDNHACQICGKTKEEIGRYPDVHHIIPFRLFDNNEEANKLTNLITLCPVHHITAERGDIDCESILNM